LVSPIDPDDIKEESYLKLFGLGRASEAGLLSGFLLRYHCLEGVFGGNAAGGSV